MSKLDQEINDIVDSCTPPPSKFKLNKAYGREIRIVVVGSVECPVKSPLADLISNELYPSWDNEELRWRVRTNCIDRDIRSCIDSNIIDFIYNNHESSNPRLTNIYQWYNNCMHQARITYREFDDIILEIWKYIKTNTETTHIQNAMNLLEAIKQKYESKGIKRR